MQFTTNTLTFDVTEWDEAFTTMKALMKNGYTIKAFIGSYLGGDEITVEFAVDDTTALEWIDENHYVSERDTNDPGFGGF